MEKKKIFWVTPDCFVDCDIPYIPSLLDTFDIYWMVFLPSKGNRYGRDIFQELTAQYTNLEVDIEIMQYRERDPRNIWQYMKIIQKIKEVVPDAIYVNLPPVSPWQIPMFSLLPKDRTIITAHQGRVHEGMGHYKYYNVLRDLVYNRIRYVNMFSQSQAELFQKRYKRSRIYQWPLGLKDFGRPVKEYFRKSGKVKFLSFGIINYAKHIDILIDAANIVYEKGIKDFCVIIKGACSNWADYEKHIKYPQIFETDIRMIDNTEIADLFSSADYFVQPYRTISQSGPFKIALNYNVPLITSNLPGFKDEMVEGVTGYLFETNNLNSLVEVMIKAIELKQSEGEYVCLKKKMKQHVESVYSESIMVQNYKQMFNSIIEKR